MDAEPVAIPSDATVERALDEYFLRYRWPWFPVVDAAQRFVGLLNRGDRRCRPRDRAGRAGPSPSCSTADAAEHDDQHVRSDAPIESLLANIELRRLGGLAAVDADGRLAGVITIEQVGRALRDRGRRSPFGDEPRSALSPNRIGRRCTVRIR